jgi:hypothetical protein
MLGSPLKEELVKEKLGVWIGIASQDGRCRRCEVGENGHDR